MVSPHVQSYLFATDSIGLRLLMDNDIFQSSDRSHLQVIMNHEIRMSQIILSAGYNIGCLLRKYEGVDFRKQDVAQCNQGANPLTPSGYDGMTVHPFEVFFVKAKASDPTWLAPIEKYTNWSAQNREPATVVAGPFTEFKRLRKDLADAVLESCGGEFDVEFYRATHSDLKSANIDLYEHWQLAGRFEGRKARYKSTLLHVTPACAFALQNPAFTAWIPQPYEES